MDISIRQLSADDGQLFRDVRLKALQSDPGVFSATHEDALKRTKADWRAFLTSPDTAVFGIFNWERPIGMTGISIPRDDATRKSALLWGSWLEPEYRGQGISKLIYAARIEWARAHPTCEKILVGHRESNMASKLANQKHGFVYTHTETARRWPDGKIEDLYNYELPLKPQRST